jgi:putative MATE family efflux protein
MLTMPIGKLLRKFTPPAMIAMSANAVLNIFEIIILGIGVGIDAFAALACTFPIIILISAFASLVNTGTASKIAMLYAENNQEQALKTFGNSVILLVSFGALLTAVLEIFLEDILRLCGASDVTLPYALVYMRIMLVSTVVLFSMQSMGRLLHIQGRPKVQMMLQIGGIIGNVILSVIFVFVFKWGMKGVALASIMCESVSWILYIKVFSNKKAFLHFTKRGFCVDFSLIKEILSIGVSPFAINACGCVVALMINHSLIDVAGEHGDMYLGSYAIVQRITQVLISLISGLGLALQIITSINVARQNYIRVRSVLMYTIFHAFVIMSLGYGFIALFTGDLMSIFTTDTQMIEIGVKALTIGLCTFPFVASQMVAVSFFQTIRRPRVSMIISLTRQLLFLMPMLIILPHFIGVTGVWWSMALADVASVTISWIMLYTETKKLSL